MKASPNIVIGVRCHYCSKFRNPKEMAKIGTGGALICWHCQEWHVHALNTLTGTQPRGCQKCGVTFKDLAAQARGDDVRMVLVIKDGIYQIHCKSCAEQYIPKRRDLYGPTRFGKRINLTA